MKQNKMYEILKNTAELHFLNSIRKEWMIKVN